MSTGCKSSLVNQVTSCLFSFVVEFANWFTFEASLKLALMCKGGGSKTVAPKIPRVVCLPHPCTSDTAASSVAREDRLDLQSKASNPSFRALDELSG